MVDYDILNTVIDEIVLIVKNYQNEKKISDEVALHLTIALTGYYLSFGVDVFKHIQCVLEQLVIYYCDSPKSCLNKKRELRPNSGVDDFCPVSTWDYILDDNKKFKGAIPIIVYFNEGIVNNVFTLIHELSHIIEGANAQVIKEDNSGVLIKQCFSNLFVSKEYQSKESNNNGMTEFIAVMIENKILKCFVDLELDKIENISIRNFVNEIKKYKGKNFLINSYEVLAGLFKDLIDSEYFFDLVKKYYFENQCGLIEEGYNSLDDRLNFNKLMLYIDKIFEENPTDVFYYMVPIRKQLDVFNEATGFKPDDNILIFV